MSTSSRGSARERQVRKQLEADGWVCVRSAASLGAVDVWALRASRRKPGFGGMDGLAVQIKGNVGSPWMHFRKVERDVLRRIAARAGATPWLVHWPPRGECRWIGVDDWP